MKFPNSEDSWVFMIITGSAKWPELRVDVFHFEKVSTARLKFNERCFVQSLQTFQLRDSPCHMIALGKKLSSTDLRDKNPEDVRIQSFYEPLYCFDDFDNKYQRKSNERPAQICFLRFNLRQENFFAIRSIFLPSKCIVQAHIDRFFMRCWLSSWTRSNSDFSTFVSFIITGGKAEGLQWSGSIKERKKEWERTKEIFLLTCRRSFRSCWPTVFAREKGAVRQGRDEEMGKGMKKPTGKIVNGTRRKPAQTMEECERMARTKNTRSSRGGRRWNSWAGNLYIRTLQEIFQGTFDRGENKGSVISKEQKVPRHSLLFLSFPLSPASSDT